MRRSIGQPAPVFLSTPSARRATVLRSRTVWRGLFLSTPSARRATSWAAGRKCPDSDFYPRPPRGGRRRLPGRRPEILQHFYPRPPRGGRPSEGCAPGAWQFISIHALREEGDVLFSGYASTNNISIHALREEGDVLDGHNAVLHPAFLSTPSARRATLRLRLQ